MAGEKASNLAEYRSWKFYSSDFTEGLVSVSCVLILALESRPCLCVHISRNEEAHNVDTCSIKNRKIAILSLYTKCGARGAIAVTDLIEHRVFVTQLSLPS